MKTLSTAPTGAARRLPTPKLFLLAAAAPFTFASAAQAQTYLEPVGGPGGSPFDRRCPVGEYLHGLELRAGDDIDAVRPICFEPVGQGERIAPGKDAGEWHGGPGGQVRLLPCPSKQGIGAVRGMRVVSEGKEIESVNVIWLFCGPVSADPFDLGAPTVSFEGAKQQPTFDHLLMGDDRTQRCPDGEVAVGVHGRAGAWVDAIGLICAAPEPHRELAQQPPPLALGRVKPPLALGRVQTTGALPEPPICKSAESARGRNSPAAPGLEQQCRLAIKQAAADAPAASPPDHWTRSLCSAARDARARSSPAAPGLEAQCAAQPAPAPIDYDRLIPKGAALTEKDPRAADLRAQQIDDASRVGFNIGMAIAETDSDFGPGKQRIHDSLRPDEQAGFRAAVDYSLVRNKNAELAAAGAPKTSSVAGMYKATLRITSDTCPFANYEQTSRADIQGPIDSSRFIIHLKDFGSVLNGLVPLSLSGGGLSYEGPVKVRAIGMPNEVPGSFRGSMAADSARFEIAFDVRGYCTISGTIGGYRL